MCGIFAYTGTRPIPIAKAIQVLGVLETEQELDEPTPVGGHGAGIVYLNPRNEFTLVKVGKTVRRSPVHELKQQLPKLAKTRSQVILGHVRRASPEFMDTIQHAECTQPYMFHCVQHDLRLLSVHNGYLENYQKLKNQLRLKHNFESEPTQLIDSEVIPHLYEEQLIRTKNPTKAAHILYEKTQGRNTIIIMQVNTETNQACIDVIQKGKTRGLVTWTTPDNTILLCSREKPALTTFNETLKENNCQETIHITRNNSVNLEAHFNVSLSLE